MEFGIIMIYLVYVTLAFMWITLWGLVPTLKRIATALEEANKIKKGDTSK